MPTRKGNILACGESKMTQVVILDMAKKSIIPDTALIHDSNCDISSNPLFGLIQPLFCVIPSTTSDMNQASCALLAPL